MLEGEDLPSGGFRAELPSSRKINAERRANMKNILGSDLQQVSARRLFAIMRTGDIYSKSNQIIGNASYFEGYSRE